MSAFFRQMIGLCLARMILDWLLPEGDVSRYAALGVELCAMLCMLRVLCAWVG